ncbi:MAG: fibronectin type III domain-containing protein, partial [Candidatus Micrarchaeota archaeon]|nr:fibronectin type III domain-containing protein [Candidatus Micrarchaeota archaeon]
CSVPPAPVITGSVTNPDSVQVSWLPYAGNCFSRWEVHKSTTSGFTPGGATGVANVTAQATTSYAVAGLSAATTYYFKIKACSTAGCNTSGQYQATTSITAPVLLSPINGAVVPSLTPTLDWSDSPGAFQYLVEMRNSSGAIIQQANSSVSNYFVPSGVLQRAKSYAWTVRSWSNGVSSAPASSTFTVACSAASDCGSGGSKITCPATGYVMFEMDNWTCSNPGTSSAACAVVHSSQPSNYTACSAVSGTMCGSDSECVTRLVAMMTDKSSGQCKYPGQHASNGFKPQCANPGSAASYCKFEQGASGPGLHYLYCLDCQCNYYIDDYYDGMGQTVPLDAGDFMVFISMSTVVSGSAKAALEAEIAALRREAADKMTYQMITREQVNLVSDRLAAAEAAISRGWFDEAAGLIAEAQTYLRTNFWEKAPVLVEGPMPLVFFDTKEVMTLLGSGETANISNLRPLPVNLTNSTSIGCSSGSPAYEISCLFEDTVNFVMKVFFKPVLLEPKYNAATTTATPKLDWTDVFGAAKYTVNIYQESTGAKIHSAEVTSSEYTVPSGVLSKHNWYQWAVIGKTVWETGVESQRSRFIVDCYEDAQCGTSQFAGQPFCLDGSVYVNKTVPACHNPRLETAYCTNDATPAINQTCQYGCMSGSCSAVPTPAPVGCAYNNPPCGFGYGCADNVCLPKAELLSPQNDSIVSSTDVLLDWSDVPGANFYDVYLSTDSNPLQSSNRTILITNISQQTVTGLQNGFTYYWLVVTGIYGQTTKVSSIFNFHVNATGCAYGNPSCSASSDCVKNACMLKKGCSYGNPSCNSGEECVDNLCKLKAGCAYSNPACGANEDCINNACVLKSGCAYDNPPCNASSDCVNNACVLKKGCSYGNPACNSSSECVDNACVQKKGCLYGNPPCGPKQVCDKTFNACMNMICSSNADCGDGSTRVMTEWCQGNKVMQRVINWTCMNPGTYSSYCSGPSIDVEKQACPASNECVNNTCVLKSGCAYSNPACGAGFACEGNECRKVACYSDADCGNQTTRFSCEGTMKAVRSTTIKKCANPGTASAACVNSTKKWEKTCSRECYKGFCVIIIRIFGSKLKIPFPFWGWGAADSQSQSSAPQEMMVQQSVMVDEETGKPVETAPAASPQATQPTAQPAINQVVTREDTGASTERQLVPGTGSSPWVKKTQVVRRGFS